MTGTPQQPTGGQAGSSTEQGEHSTLQGVQTGPVEHLSRTLRDILQQRHASPHAFRVLDSLVHFSLSAQERANLASQQADYMLQQHSNLQQRLAALEQANLNVQQPNILPQQPPPATGSYLSDLAKLFRKELPSTFDGNSAKMNTWLFTMDQFFELAEIHGDIPRCKFLASRLSGRARVWWQTIQSRSSFSWSDGTYEDIKNELRAQFADVDRELKLRRSLSQLRQDKSVQQYVSQFKRLQLELGELRLDDGAAIYQFLVGLKDSVRERVLLARPDSFEDAVLMAERADIALGSNRVFSRDAFYPKKPRDTSTPMDLDFGESSSAPQGKKPITCYYCGKTGHIKKDCFKFQRAQKDGKGKQPMHDHSAKN